MIGYFEDVEIGRTIEIGTHLFTVEDIKRFAKRFDPQPFHVDEAAARTSLFGALCASGWQTAMIWARLMADHHRRLTEDLRHAGAPAPRLGPSPAVRQLRWLKPVYAGSVIAYASKVADKREEGAPSGWGVIAVDGTGVDEAGDLVISFRAELMVERRNGRGP